MCSIITKLFYFIILLQACKAIVKTWLPNNNIMNHKNWLNSNPYQENCSGIIFSNERIFQYAFLDEIYHTKQIILPNNGEIIIMEDAEIVLGPYNYCVKLKMLRKYDWIDDNNWNFVDFDNMAIPNLEKLPCQYDDVVFPNGIHSAVTFDVILFQTIKIRSLKFDGKLYKDDEFRQFQKTAVGQNVFEGISPLVIEQRNCNDITGCLCNPYLFCTSNRPFSSNINHKCLNPIRPRGFCVDEKICGAYILFKPLNGFSLEKIRLMLNVYKVDTFASKILNNTNEVIQIVFTEKQFTGASLNDARTFYEILKQQQIIQLEFYSSGEFYEDGIISKMFLSMVFGTLVGVFLLFLFLYVFYETDTIKQGKFNYIWAKYDTRDESGLIFGENVSLTGSVASLEKSFDNPMYGQASTSTMMEQHENPLYDLKSIEEQQTDNADNAKRTIIEEHEE